VDAWAGNPSVAFVEGESGMGKSTLLSKFLGHVASARILRAGGDEAEMLMPYGLIEQIVEGAGTGSVAGMKVLGSSIDADTDPLAVGSELLELLGFLQSDCPVVLAIDDLHWADSRPRPKPSSSRSDGCKAIKCSPS
jgi:hypothetical protein